MKDLIITTISKNYNWSDIKNWIISIKRTDYAGEILCICYNFESENNQLLKKLKDEYGVIIVCPKHDFNGNETDFIWDSGLVTKQNSYLSICNIRHFHIWQYLMETGTQNYNRIIHTDSRDVIFQSNPSTWLDANMKNNILLGSEMVLYKDQRWNVDNSINAFGGFAFEYILKNTYVKNAGSFAIKSNIALDFFINLHFLCCYSGFSDQSALNLLVSTLLKRQSQISEFYDGWSLQVGGIGENNIKKYAHITDGILYDNLTNKPYVLVHQYDRVNCWKFILDHKYE